MVIRRPAAALALAGLLLLPACGSDEPDLSARASDTGAPATPSPSPDGSPSAGPTSAPPDEQGGEDGLPPFPAGTAVDTAEPSGGLQTVVAVRAARQDGYDRVVFELAGEEPGEPGWRVEYVDEPRQDGSGNLVEVAGDAVLQVVVTGVGYPFDTGQEEASTDLTPAGTELVREVDLQATYEGQWQAFVGLAEQAPFRVFRLADPARVVVDVAHP